MSATRNDSSLMQAPYPPAIHHHLSIWQRIRLAKLLAVRLRLIESSISHACHCWYDPAV